MPLSDQLVTSAQRFDDGASWRVEIPSVESPQALMAVIVDPEAMPKPSTV